MSPRTVWRGCVLGISVEEVGCARRHDVAEARGRELVHREGGERATDGEQLGEGGPCELEAARLSAERCELQRETSRQVQLSV